MKTLISSALLLSSLFIAAPSFACDDHKLEISGSYVREMPPASKNTAAYMQLKNTTDKPLKLLEVQSDIAKKIELHNIVNVDGVLKMQPQPYIEIAANNSLTLKPGSYHVMMMGVKRQLKQGEEVKMTLKFEGGMTRELTAPVQPIVPKSAKAEN
ncbi:copper chaperone PCu(A)C [Spartinivicinus poritis]|uniref:Copper chaperone PCu(A)C n=1 Tax=Spartinivicinus poritis TaxID=2994640 RepID=A0ABT5U9N4_9GAMM|nr:copper chaperone PCu(A)C [Spartinivicinus sp. A2-2]MDE1463072.1 copper chaperone PCu(A)C [Spartinivicinus sp. A2-2]